MHERLVLCGGVEYKGRRSRGALSLAILGSQSNIKLRLLELRGHPVLSATTLVRVAFIMLRLVAFAVRSNGRADLSTQGQCGIWMAKRQIVLKKTRESLGTTFLPGNQPE